MPRGRPRKCPYCGSTSTVSKGYRKTVTQGDKPLRKCRSCGRRFTIKTPVTKKKA